MAKKIREVSREELERMYKTMTDVEIAEKFDVSFTTVTRVIDEAGIPRKGKGQGIGVGRPRKLKLKNT